MQNMTTNLKTIELIISKGDIKILQQAARNLAERLDIIANMKPESPVGQLQLITGAEFLYPHY
jgi:hypothetical protein